jgi:hypothetical protein
VKDVFWIQLLSSCWIHAFLSLHIGAAFQWEFTDMPMKVAVYDTYVRKKDGSKMHFDVVVPDGTPQEKALEFAKRYLESVGQGGQQCSARECQFCHTEPASVQIENSIRSNSYHIIEMEGCREA